MCNKISQCRLHASLIFSVQIPRRSTQVAEAGTVGGRPVFVHWRTRVRVGVTVAPLVDTGRRQRVMYYTPKCILCSDKGAAPPATAWCADCDISLCEGCQKAHRRIPATRHHDVSDLSTEVKINQKRKPFCKQYPDQSMQFYCKDCKKLQCQSFWFLYHRKCEAILPFESVMPELISCVTRVKERLASHLQATDSLLTDLETKRTEVMKNRVTVQCQIRSTIQTVTEATMKKERQLLDQLDDATEKQIERLKTEIKSEEMAKQMISHHSVMIDRALESGSEMDIYEMYLWYESEEFPTVYGPDSDIKYELKEKSSPRRIAKLNAHHMAVTLPETREIIVIEVNPDLVLQSYVSTRKKYFGLTALTSTTLAAGSGSPPCVDILDMAGNVLRTLNRVTDGGTLVSDPLFL
ncbi:E3 ubiquitin-protein ligase TRIM56-like [Haliotis rufescens]|uniref:E3 ubiquitin-protein ligase TRIM56-like n=1 Tax=Haliotis rufescens TaxID=6454 RepID=UPI00201F61CF|nr:E3 ubiquitin-protein ligase TRIM56-like [Haliotis rufescens]